MSPERPILAFAVPFLDSLSNWIDPLAPWLVEAGYAVHIYHMHGLSYGVAATPARIHDVYTLRDVSDMSPAAIDRHLREHRPILAGFLNFQSLYELLMLRLCRDRDIPTFYMQHGRYSERTFQYLMSRPAASAARYARLGGKLAEYWLRSGAGPALAWSFGRALVGRDYRALRTDYALLYSRGSARFIHERLGYPDDRVFLCGFPLAPTAEDLQPGTADGGPPVALYVHQTHIRNGHAGISEDQERDYLGDIARACASSGFRLMLRPHPREAPARYADLAGRLPLTLDSEPRLARSVSAAAVVLGQTSSALLAAVRLRKPLLLVYYPGLRQHDPDLDDVGLKVGSAAELAAVLADSSRLTSRLSAYAGYVEEYIGPHNTYRRWAETIIGLAARAAAPAS